MNTPPHYYRKYTCKEIGVSWHIVKYLPGIAAAMYIPLCDLVALLAGRPGIAKMPYDELPKLRTTTEQDTAILNHLGLALDTERSARRNGKRIVFPEVKALSALVAAPVQCVYMPSNVEHIDYVNYKTWCHILEQYSPWVNRDINHYEQWPCLLLAGGQVEIAILPPTQGMVVSSVEKFKRCVEAQ